MSKFMPAPLSRRLFSGSKLIPLSLLSLLFISLFVAMPVMAQEEGLFTEEDPLGPIGEVVAIVIAIVALGLLWNTVKGIGGSVGVGLKMIFYAILVITLGFVVRVVGELGFIFGESTSELLFEGLVVLGMIATVVGARKLAQLSK